ncbi:MULTISPECIES: hypothetical protein [Pectinatus]|uniref:hypothetical protein n=1 Tax=Pectinatus TaxID=864 RepID=UPI0018C648AF|nr:MULTISPECIES: hypothetical protein [Pectinatus]
MEMQLNVNISAPELVQAINNLAGALAGKITVPAVVEAPKSTEKEETAEAPKQHRKKAAKPAAVKPETAPSAEEPSETTSTEKSEDELRTELKKLAVEKARGGKNGEVKAIIESTGSVKLSGIAADLLPDVLEKVRAL